MNSESENQFPNSFKHDKPRGKSSGDSFMIVSVATFILIAIAVIVFFYNQNQNLKTELSFYKSTPTSVGTPSPTLKADLPIVKSPAAKARIKSPLKISGTVPAGWAYEGVFPIKLLDSEENVIASGQAKETIAGSWQTGESIDFTASLVFKIATGTGTLVLENDNPSGNPENAKSFEIPITF
jgi:hypothetical protein